MSFFPCLTESTSHSADTGPRVRIPRNSIIAIMDRAFCYCEFLTSVTIPEGDAAIGTFAFVGCTSLTSVKIPESVTIIGVGAFLFSDSRNGRDYTGPIQGLTVTAAPGSFAEQYCERYGIAYRYPD